MFLLLQAVAAMFMSRSDAIAIDNGVADTMVLCTPSDISVTFAVRKPFSGRIFVKGMVDTPGCLASFTNQPGSGTAPSMSFRFGACNMQRTRTVTPQRGMMQSLTVIISFHKHFITKVDRAYRVQCFYMEAEKTVKSQLEVSMLTTADIRNTVRMPVCTYSVRSGSRGGPVTAYARVGDKVFHEWECDSDAYRMLVKNCYVDDGKGNQFQTIDNRGCSIDPIIMGDLTYESGPSTKAWVQTHVFKYADRSSLYFTCSIQLCPITDQECAGISVSSEPPTCTSNVNYQQVAQQASAVTRDESQQVPAEAGSLAELLSEFTPLENSAPANDNFVLPTITLNNTHALNDSAAANLQRQQSRALNSYFTFSRRQRTASASRAVEFDLTSNPLSVIDLSEDSYADTDEFSSPVLSPGSRIVPTSDVCLSPLSLGLLMFLTLFVFGVALVTSLLFCQGRLKTDSRLAFLKHAFSM